MAQVVQGTSIAATMDVHVTGRRILATIVDGLAFGVLYTVMTALFGTITTVGPANWNGSLPAFWSVVYGVIIVLYYILLEGYPGRPSRCPSGGGHAAHDPHIFTAISFFALGRFRWANRVEYEFGKHKD